MTKTFLIASMMTMALTSANAVKISMVNDDKDFRWEGPSANLEESFDPDFQSLAVKFSLKSENWLTCSPTFLAGCGALQITPPKTVNVTSFDLLLDYEIRTIVDRKLVYTVKKQVFKDVTVQADDHIEFRLKKITRNPTDLFYTLSNINTPDSPVVLASKLPPAPLSSVEGNVNDVDKNFENAHDSDEDFWREATKPSKWQKFKNTILRR